MKRTGPTLVIAALFGLTACTDQPIPEEPTPPQTVEPSPSSEEPQIAEDALPAEERVVRIVESVLPQAETSATDTGTAALEHTAHQALNAIQANTADDELDDCVGQLEARPEVAVYGAATSAEPDETTTLSALGFTESAAAEEFTAQLQDMVSTCGDEDENLTVLTHHTDEAFALPDSVEDDTENSMVVVRSEQWVLATSSQPASDIALALTTVDQLDEMLR